MTNGRDAIDAAIDAAVAPPPAVPRMAIQVTLATTKRVVGIEAPLDLTEGELLDFMGWLGQSYIPGLRAAARPGGGRIILPGRG